MTRVRVRLPPDVVPEVRLRDLYNFSCTLEDCMAQLRVLHFLFLFFSFLSSPLWGSWAEWTKLN